MFGFKNDVEMNTFRDELIENLKRDYVKRDSEISVIRRSCNV